MTRTGRAHRPARTILLTALAAGMLATTSDAQSDASDVGPLHVQGRVHMLVLDGGNMAVQVGDDGVLLVDTRTAALAPRALTAIRTLSDRPIHTIINTHVHADHTGGNDLLVAQRGTGAPQAVRVMAHAAVLNRMVAAAAEQRVPVTGFRLNQAITVPINNTYDTPARDFYLNGESVVLHHEAAAHTDGDTLVHFRGSDVLAVGDLFTPDRYPVIDLENGGSIQGVIDALNHILELTVPARFQEGGTYVVPGHGRLSDEADVVEFRDMVTIVRDRVQHLIRSGLTLEQVLAARPSRDYDPSYRPEFNGPTPAAFVETIYRSLAK